VLAEVVGLNPALSTVHVILLELSPETPVSSSPLIYRGLSIETIEMMMVSERKNNRGKIQIMGDVLALGTSGIRKTHIMYKCL
jgi:predicted transcriptional regulator